MKINIISTGRFHLLDIARELSLQGNNVRFYSYVSSKRCEKYGLNKNLSVNFIWLAAPFLLLNKIFPKCLTITRIRNIVIDYYVAITMRKCDVLICLGSVYNYSLRKAKKNGSVTILEWGSLHILEQLKLFGENHPKWSIKNELWEYEECDYISIAANHVAKSFIDNGVNGSKLLVNPYGVDLSQFGPTTYTGQYDLIYVGGWRKEKGCELLIQLCEEHPEIKLIHIGALINLEFPKFNNMTHIEAVDQKELIKYYSQAKVFVLPSKADGFGMVLSQAMVCGLPLIYSKYTGGSTLKDLIQAKDYLFEMQNLDWKSIYQCYLKAKNLSDSMPSKRNYLGDSIINITWKAYGIRYNTNINNIINESKRYYN